MVAAKRGFDDIVNMLLAAGANPNAKDSPSSLDEGRLTALHLAAEHGHASTCRILLEHGADPNSTTQSHRTPLNYACHARSLAAIKELLAHGADPNGSTRGYETPLIAACLCDDSKLVKALLDAEADPNLKSASGAFPLIMTSDIDCIKELLIRGANVNVQDREGKTVLWGPIHAGNLGLLQFYIRAGANVNIRDNNGYTPLMLLTNEPRIEIAEMLIAARADVNAHWQPNISLLDFICHDQAGSASRRVRRRELVEYLRSKGAKTGKELQTTG
jgi:uncharacterized protein